MIHSQLFPHLQPMPQDVAEVSGDATVSTTGASELDSCPDESDMIY